MDLERLSLQAAKILGHLRTHNEKTNPERWKVFGVGTEPKGFRLILGIRHSFPKEMAKSDYRLHLGLTMLTFRVLCDEEEQTASRILFECEALRW